jgi:anti-sigma B factor antagonist
LKGHNMENLEKPGIKVNYREGFVMALLMDEEILDENAIKRLSDELTAEAKSNAPAKMIVNFARVKRLSSASLGAFIRLNANVENAGGKLALCRLIPVLHQLFLITKLDKIFAIYPDEETAMKGLK